MILIDPLGFGNYLKITLHSSTLKAMKVMLPRERKLGGSKGQRRQQNHFILAHSEVLGGRTNINCERVLKPISLLKLQDQRSSLTAQLVDSDGVHGKSNHKIAKILFIQNEGRIAPYKTKGFVRSVRELLIDKCGYDFVYGHSANCDQLDHQHNSLGTDKRFDNHHNFSLTIDSKQHAFAVSNLCHFWNLMGFTVTPSPENENDLAVSLMSAEYKKFLLNLAPELWGQVFDYNKSAKQKQPIIFFPRSIYQHHN